MRRPVTAAVLVTACLLSAAVSAQTTARVLVLPFENVTRDSQIVWLGEASAVLLADEINALGHSAITREDRRAAFTLLQIPPSATLTDATLIRIGELVRASQIVVGTLQREGDTLVVRARVIGLEAARVQSDATERGALPELFTTFERLARRIAPPVSGSTERKVSHPPVAAFENYIKGLVAETPATAVAYLNAALAAQPGFDRARLALWDLYAEQGEHEKALASLARVRAGSEYFPRARFLSGLSQLHLGRNDDAFATFKALTEDRPTPAVFSNLGVVQLRRGSTAQTGTPAFYFDKAVNLDPTEPDYCFNLGYAYLVEHDPSAATYWLRESVRRNPSDGDAHYLLGVALNASGNPAEANREKELARRLSSTYAEWEKRPAAEAVPKGLERIADDIERPRTDRVEATLATAGQRDMQELATFYLDRGRRLYQQERDRDALAELNRALFLSPYQPEAHLLVGRIHLRGGRARDAIDALKISLWSAETAEAHAVLAAAYLDLREQDLARTDAERALALDPASVEARRVLDQLAAR